jgi:histidinol phosphatase-like enzyme
MFVNHGEQKIRGEELLDKFRYDTVHVSHVFYCYDDPEVVESILVNYCKKDNPDNHMYINITAKNQKKYLEIFNEFEYDNMSYVCVSDNRTCIKYYKCLEPKRN